MKKILFTLLAAILLASIIVTCKDAGVFDPNSSRNIVSVNVCIDCSKLICVCCDICHHGPCICCVICPDPAHCTCPPCNECNSPGRCICIIYSPYKNVNWSWYQYKASHHSHTTNSDGSVTLSAVIEEHYLRGYDILTITDHSEFEHHLFTTATESAHGLTAARLAEMTAGAGRANRGMVIVPGTSEQRVGGNAEEINAFWYPEITFQGPPWNNAWVGWSTTFEHVMTKVQNAGGIAFINHPGRTTGGNNTTHVGTRASNNPLNVRTYANRYLAFKNCIGMEIVNREDGDSRNERILWDNVLKITIPQGKYVWGFANDDSHSNNAIGVNINMFLMPENNLANVRSTMMNGNFYMVARTAHHEGVNIPRASTLAFPKITNIEVCNTNLTITIDAEESTRIIWIAGGTSTVSGEDLSAGGGIKIGESTSFPATIALNDLDDISFDEIGAFVRANIIGPGGIAFTQPFGIRQ